LVKAYHQDLAPSGVAGEHIALALAIHDANGAVIPDGMVEIWQPTAMAATPIPKDRRNLPLDANFDGFGRASTDTKGVARFTTVRPGCVALARGRHAGATHQCLDLRPRRAQPAGDAALFDDDPALRRIPC